MKEIDFKVQGKDEAFWQQEIRVLTMQIDSIQQEMRNGDKIIKIHENSIKYCQEELKKLQNTTQKGGTKQDAK